MDVLEDEINLLKKQCSELLKDRDAALQERDVLKQKCSEAIFRWNLITSERNNLKENLKKLLFQHKETIKELKLAIANNLHTEEELDNVRKAHDSVLEEYNLVMGERDEVHNEIDKLTTELSFANNKTEVLEKEIKFCRNEIKTLLLNIECFKREITSIGHERDEAFKKCHDYQEKFGEMATKNKCQREYKINLNDRISRENAIQNISQKNKVSLGLFGSSQNKPVYNLDEANREIERLKKSVVENYTALIQTRRETGVSNRRRVWAFDERDKINSEREKLKTQCDNFRTQLDDVVKKSTSIMKYCHRVTEQKNDNAVVPNDHEDRSLAQLDREVRLLKLQTTNIFNERSANELQNLDTEILNVYLNFSGSNESLGFDFLGGKDEPLYPNDNAVYISYVDQRGLAANKLKVNDCILKVNGIDCSFISKRLVLQTMRTLKSATLVIKRKKPASSHESLFTTQLQVNNHDHGITLGCGIYIKKITPGSLAAKDGNLNVGDRVLSINNVSMDNIKNSREAMLLLYDSASGLTITTLKPSHCANYCGSGLNRHAFKKYTNSTSQTDRCINSTFQESQQQLQCVQPRRVARGVPERRLRNFSLTSNNDILERNQRDAIAGLDSAIFVFKSQLTSTTTNTTATNTTISTNSAIFTITTTSTSTFL